MNRFLDWAIATVGAICASVIIISCAVQNFGFDPIPPTAYMVKITYPDGGHGSGVVVGPGLVITARHVAKDGMILEHGSGSVPGEIIWTGGKDMKNDLALVKFDPKGLNMHSLPVNCHTPVKVGDAVEVYGFALDMDLLRTTGTVAGFIHDMMIVDATIAPGNSGGPVIHNGELVGISVAIPLVPLGFYGVALLPYDIVVKQDNICTALGKELR